MTETIESSLLLWENHENCPGCKIDRLKQADTGVPVKHLFYVWIVVLAAGTCTISISFSISCFFLFLPCFLLEMESLLMDEVSGSFLGF